jgi:hypothetical protein
MDSLSLFKSTKFRPELRALFMTRHAGIGRHEGDEKKPRDPRGTRHDD